MYILRPGIAGEQQRKVSMKGPRKQRSANRRARRTGFGYSMPPIGKGNPKSCVRIQALGSKVTKKTRDPTKLDLSEFFLEWCSH